MIEFDLASESAQLASSGVLDGVRDLAEYDVSERKDMLHTLIDQVSALPDSVLEDATFNEMQRFCASLAILSASEITKLSDLISAALVGRVMRIAQEGAEDLDQNSRERIVIEVYAFHLFVILKAVLSGGVAAATDDSAAARPKSKKSKEVSGGLNVPEVLVGGFDAMTKVMGLRAAKMWPTTSERAALVSLFTKPAYLVIENETLLKRQDIKMRVFKVISVAVKHHGQAFSAQTTVIQMLQYFEHVPECMAELLQVLGEQFDYTQLTDEVLRELSNKEFNANDNKGPKTIGAFIVKLSELVPRHVLKQIGLLANFLDCESHYLRLAIIDICGNLIASLVADDENEGASDARKTQINGFFDLLQERFLDQNPYCRSKVLQSYIKICDLPNKFPKRRQTACDLAVRSLEDRSSYVRRNAVKLLARLMQTHPFDMLHGPHLSLKEWQDRMSEAQKELELLGASDKPKEAIEAEPDTDLLEAPTSPQKPMAQEDEAEEERRRQKDAARQDSIMKLQMTKRFYADALKFVESLERGSELICQLLASKTKTEVVESMDFFVVADAYKLDSSKVGIRRMLHLIWTKATNDEGRGVTQHLLECYRGLFFDPPEQLSANDAANFVAKNMISLTYGATLAELTSLEQLLKVTMQEGYIAEEAVVKLWQVFGVRRRDISKSQRRGAIIVLGMLALASQDIIVNGLEVLLQIAFGPIGRSDMRLTKYACIALQRIGEPEKQAKGELRKRGTKLPNTHDIFKRLRGVIVQPCATREWFAVAEQAVNAIYALAEHPDEIASDIVRAMTANVFGHNSAGRTTPPPEADDDRSSPSAPEAVDDEMMDADVDADDDRPVDEDSRKASLGNNGARLLADLLFVVGHVSIKQIVYIEECEAEFKRRKAEQDRARQRDASPVKAGAGGKKVGAAAEEKDDLDMVGGTTEDDFSDAMAHIREKELLYGKASLLSRFGPLAADICRNNHRYDDATLQTCATMTLAKFMCVSSQFCEENLQLLCLILEKSESAATRSNLVIAMGDMTVCFNHVLDDCSAHLYRRLRDEDSTVRKTCLMTLTFLVLAGQVKVKGQLGEMAKCLEDEDRRVADLARVFFTELSTKDNAIYNGFTDIFSLLSQGDAETGKGALDEDSLRRVVKFLLGFVERDRHAKQLAEKLVTRLATCRTQRQWDDCCFALSCLPQGARNEQINKIIADGFQFVQPSQAPASQAPPRRQRMSVAA